MAVSDMQDRVSKEPSKGPWRRCALQWGPFLLVGMLCLLFVGIDATIKQSDTLGIAPAEAEWQLSAADVPTVWSAWVALSSYDALHSHAPPFMELSAVAVRKRMGVRPTPQRFAFWLGHGIVLAGNGSDWCMSVRPGVAMRIATALHTFVASESASDIRSWDNVYYTWRDGFLLTASSAGYLSTMLETGKTVPRSDEISDALTLSWNGAGAGSLRVFAREGLPFEAELEDGAEFSDGPLSSFAQQWPDAMLLFSGADGKSLNAMSSRVQDLVASRLPHGTYDAWRTLAVAWWDGEVPSLSIPDCTGETTWLVFPPEKTAADEKLRFGEWQHGCLPDYLRVLDQLDSARPYRWDDREGWLITSSRNRAPWATAQDGAVAAWSSDPTLIPEILGVTTEGTTTGALYFRIQWSPAVARGKELLSSLATQGLLFRQNADDLNEKWFPYLDGLGQWGHLECRGESHDGTLRLRGKLALSEVDR